MVYWAHNVRMEGRRGRGRQRLRPSTPTNTAEGDSHIAYQRRARRHRHTNRCYWDRRRRRMVCPGRRKSRRPRQTNRVSRGLGDALEALDALDALLSVATGYGLARGARAAYGYAQRRRTPSPRGHGSYAGSRYASGSGQRSSANRPSYQRRVGRMGRGGSFPYYDRQK